MSDFALACWAFVGVFGGFMVLVFAATWLADKVADAERDRIIRLLRRLAQDMDPAQADHCRRAADLVQLNHHRPYERSRK